MSAAQITRHDTIGKGALEVESRERGALARLGLSTEGKRPRVAVLGLARSGLAVARLLSREALDLELLDLKAPGDPNEPELQAKIDLDLRELDAAGATLKIGPHDADWLAGYDLLIKSPGIPPRVPFVAEAMRRGVRVVGELEVAWLLADGPVFAITGTNGKSTTTAWAGDMLRRAGMTAEICGNIGRPFSEVLLSNPRGPFVVEVSSFQLADSRSFKPRVAALLNFTPDHLDYHRDLREYREAKLSLFWRLGPEEIAILGNDDALAAEAIERSHPRLCRFRLEDRGEDGGFLRDGVLWLRLGGEETRLVEADRVSLPGPHNLENALAAAIGARVMGAPPSAIVESLAHFPGLHHRLERVGEIRGVRFVNDSKATNVDSLEVALRSFERPVVLIAGGRDKGQDFTPLASLVRERVETLVLIGEGADRIGAAWSGVATQRAPDFAAAVRQAFEAATPGQTVLLSPACSSFDMFRNYEHRGDCFRREVERLAKDLGESDA